MDVVIIEDEPLLAEKLRLELTKADQQIRITAILGSIAEAINHFQKAPSPHLIFSDIQLSDGLSFEIFRNITLQVPVVFCTAYDEYALEAFKANGIDYILKPFTSEDILTTLDKFRQLSGKDRGEPTRDLLEGLEQVVLGLKGKDQSSILIHLKDRILPIRKQDICLALVENSITYILTTGGKRYIQNDNLDTLHQRLGDSFYRVNRQYIINREGIESVSQYFARKLLIHPNFEYPEPLVISKANATHFLNWLQDH